MVPRVIDGGWSVAEAAAAAGVSGRTCRRWVGRYRAEGDGAAVDPASVLLVVERRATDVGEAERAAGCGPARRAAASRGSRAAMTRSAIMSIAVSRSSSSHSVPWGRGYLTLVSRVDDVTSWRVAELFGHRRPRGSASPGVALDLDWPNSGKGRRER
jgi:hypothetical protein